MKIKRQREDFVVRELSRLSIGDGSHAVYRLDKSGLGTPEAITEILSLWNLPRHRISYGGLKDRHAVTSQTVTIFQGPKKSLERPAFLLEYLGQARREFTARDILANEFDITLRELEPALATRMLQACQTQQLAVPNYFDDQRFGSLGTSGHFVAHPWCLGDYERALFLAIADANPHDRSDDREQKEILRDLWGDWKACKERLDRSHRRSIVTYLVDHPMGFKKAIALIRKDLRSIYIAAFQAKLWNEVVSRTLMRDLRAEQLLVLAGVGGKWAYPCRLTASQLQQLRSISIPLPSGRQTQWQPEVRQILDQVLSELGLERHKLRFSHPRDVFFSRGERDMLLIPQQLTAKLGHDEYGSPNAHKLHLRFQLKPGQYATMLIKGLALLAAQPSPAK